MGLILAGILVAVLLVGLMFLYMSFSKNPDATLCTGLTIIAIVCVIGGIFAGIK